MHVFILEAFDDVLELLVEAHIERLHYTSTARRDQDK